MRLLVNPHTLDPNFEIDPIAARRYRDADVAGQRAALKASGKGSSCSDAYTKAYDASLDASFEVSPRRSWK